MKEDNGFYALNAFLVHNKEMGIEEKFLLMLIVRGSNAKGYCWSSNAYFCEAMGVTINTLKKHMTDLIDKGFITRELIRDENKEIKERRLRLTSKSTFDTLPPKSGYTPPQKLGTPPPKVCPDLPPKIGLENKEINKESNIELKSEETPPLTRFEILANNSLIKDEDPILSTDNRYITAGRRPMKNYPDIWITPYQLADVFSQYDSDGISLDNKNNFLGAFKAVQARLQTYKEQGKPLININPYIWLIGWAKEDLIKALTAKNNLKRSELYLDGALKK
jgi:hypothetical protein